MPPPIPPPGFHGPKCWLITTLIGAALGLILWQLLPARYPAPSAINANTTETLVVEKSGS